MNSCKLALIGDVALLIVYTASLNVVELSYADSCTLVDNELPKES